MKEKKQLSLAELAIMRDKGIVKDSDAAIAEKRAARAEKKAKKASQEEIKKHFPGGEATAVRLIKLKDEIRNRRKNAVNEGITSFSLPKEIKDLYFMAFEKLDFKAYRSELNNLSIEGLKVQDREVKVFTYRFYDKLLANGFEDWGWIISMLGRQYVSRYGWALLRKHRDSLFDIGRNVLPSLLKRWADDPETRKKWARLSKDDNLPEDMRELYSSSYRQ